MLQVNSNGLISFGASITNEYTPRPLPISDPSTPFMAPYWADVDTTINNARIYYRNVTGKYIRYCDSHDETKATAIKLIVADFSVLFFSESFLMLYR